MAPISGRPTEGVKKPLSKAAAAALFLFALLTPVCLVLPVRAQTPLSGEGETLSYLKGLSIEELVTTEITSVSKKSEPLFNTAAAISVITGEDLRRAGIHLLPEALRMVPGMAVARIDGSRWAISARGFNDYFANKMLVLIDGRSVYTPLFSGVYWNVQDTLIEDIERIEVIRGPGAAIWGANAVNGVVNIITKHTRKTQGGYLSAAAGSHERPLAAARYGGALDPETTYRLFAKGFNRAPLEARDGGEAHDAWESLRAGFRMDRTLRRDDLSVQGEIYDGQGDATLSLSGFPAPPFSRDVEATETFGGGHLLGRWEHRFSPRSDIETTLYYDRTQRDQYVTEEERDTFDIEVRHRWNPEGAHDVVWGLGYRWTGDRIENSEHISLSPDSRDTDLWSAFVQDDIALFPDRLWITIGSKFEHNDYSGFEVQPSLRLRAAPAENQTLWAAVSRAVRTPSRADHDCRITAAVVPDPRGNLAVVRILGTDDFDAEELIAYEVGYRWLPGERLSVDLAAFFNEYDDLRVSAPADPYLEPAPPPPHLVVPQYITNRKQGETYGVELGSTWQAADRLKLFFNYTWLRRHLSVFDPDTGRTAHSEVDSKGNPEHQVHLRAYLDLPWNLTLDTEIYYVSELEKRNNDGYLRLDARLGWSPWKNLEISLNGENLFDDGHTEFPAILHDVALDSPSYMVHSEIPTQWWLEVAHAF